MNLLASHNKDNIMIIRIKHPQDSLCSHQPKNPESFLTFLYKFLETYADIKIYIYGKTVQHLRQCSIYFKILRSRLRSFFISFSLLFV